MKPDNKASSNENSNLCKAAMTTAIQLRFDSPEKVGVVTVR